MSWYRMNKLGQNGIIVYQGRYPKDSLSNFYSSDEFFASDYGQVKKFLLMAKNIFDSCNKEHLEFLFDKIGSIEDSYDDRVFETAEEYYNSNLMGTDTWESIEPYIWNIRMLGYDAIKVYEGGIENYYVISPEKSIKSIYGKDNQNELV